MDVNDRGSLAPESSAAGKAPNARGQVIGEVAPDPPPAATNNFQFLTFTDFQQTTDPRTKKKVRSHVMHRVHQTMRSGERAQREGVIVLDTSPLLGEPSAPQEHQGPTVLPPPCTLGAGRSNPFANYPIPMNTRTRHLFDHCRLLLCPTNFDRC